MDFRLTRGIGRRRGVLFGGGATLKGIYLILVNMSTVIWKCLFSTQLDTALPAIKSRMVVVVLLFIFKTII